jgi:7-cyano-7-deazaguanine synthase
MPRAVVLLSGGMDSASTLAVAQSLGFSVSALSFRYGQRHAAEIEAARNIAQSLSVDDHVVVDIDLRLFGGSALTDEIAVPRGRSLDEMTAGVPVTYVPARNTIFLSFGLALAEVREASDLFIGVNALDYSGYPDCRPEYLAAYEAMARLATARGVRGDHPVSIHAPLIDKTKAQVIYLGSELGVDFSLTVSCYEATADGLACGYCDACVLRRRGFQECGLTDPTRYVEPEAIRS